MREGREKGKSYELFGKYSLFMFGNSCDPNMIYIIEILQSFRKSKSAVS